MDEKDYESYARNRDSNNNSNRLQEILSFWKVYKWQKGRVLAHLLTFADICSDAMQCACLLAKKKGYRPSCDFGIFRVILESHVKSLHDTSSRPTTSSLVPSHIHSSTQTAVLPVEQRTSCKTRVQWPWVTTAEHVARPGASNFPSYILHP
jgi:hypothetical protein